MSPVAPTIVAVLPVRGATGVVTRECSALVSTIKVIDRAPYFHDCRFPGAQDQGTWSFLMVLGWSLVHEVARGTWREVDCPAMDLTLVVLEPVEHGNIWQGQRQIFHWVSLEYIFFVLPSSF